MDAYVEMWMADNAAKRIADAARTERDRWLVPNPKEINVSYPPDKGNCHDDQPKAVPASLTDSLDRIQVIIDRIEARQDEQSKIIADMSKAIADLQAQINNNVRG